MKFENNVPQAAASCIARIYTIQHISKFASANTFFYLPVKSSVLWEKKEGVGVKIRIHKELEIDQLCNFSHSEKVCIADRYTSLSNLPRPSHPTTHVFISVLRNIHMNENWLS